MFTKFLTALHQPIKGSESQNKTKTRSANADWRAVRMGHAHPLQGVDLFALKFYPDGVVSHQPFLGSDN